jgi:hypothetical protein
MRRRHAASSGALALARHRRTPKQPPESECGPGRAGTGSPGPGERCRGVGVRGLLDEGAPGVAAWRVPSATEAAATGTIAVPLPFFSGAVRSRVREELVREGVRGCELGPHH